MSAITRSCWPDVEGPVPNPIVDLKDKDPVQVNRDMAMCQREASSKIIALAIR
jgi:hypothetical protein